MRYIEGENRSQINLFPKCLDEMIDENNIVRIIDALVETFNIEAMNFTHSITKSTGRKPYNPKDILKKGQTGMVLFCPFLHFLSQ